MAKKLKLNFSAPGVLHLDFSPRVFMRDKTRTYLLLRDGSKKSFFLTMEEGQIDVVQIPKEEGDYRVYKLNEGEVNDKNVKRVYHSLTPTNHDLLHAAQVYWNSTLTKTPRAERELRVILGMPVGAEIPEDGVETPVKKKRSTGGTGKGTGGSGALDLAGICTELGLEPSKARKLLRGHMEKPQGGWQWQSLDAATQVKELLKNLL